MSYFVTRCVFLITSFMMSCSHRKPNVGYTSLEDIPAKTPKLAVIQKSIPSEQKNENLPAQNIAILPQDTRTIVPEKMSDEALILSLKKLKKNILSPIAFQAISQAMEVDGAHASSGSKYHNDKRFVVDFYNPKVLDWGQKFVIKQNTGNTGAYSSDRLYYHAKYGNLSSHLSESDISNYSKIFTKNVFSNASDEIDAENFGYDLDKTQTKFAHIHMYNSYKSDPNRKDIPLIEFELYGVKDTDRKQVSVSGFGSVTIEEHNNSAIQLRFGTRMGSGSDQYYEDRVILDENGKPQNGKLTMWYSEHKSSVPKKDAQVFDFSDLSVKEKEALKRLRIFNLQ